MLKKEWQKKVRQAYNFRSTIVGRFSYNSDQFEWWLWIPIKRIFLLTSTKMNIVLIKSTNWKIRNHQDQVIDNFHNYNRRRQNHTDSNNQVAKIRSSECRTFVSIHQYKDKKNYKQRDKKIFLNLKRFYFYRKQFLWRSFFRLKNEALFFSFFEKRNLIWKSVVKTDPIKNLTLYKTDEFLFFVDVDFQRRTFIHSSSYNDQIKENILNIFTDDSTGIFNRLQKFFINSASLDVFFTIIQRKFV